MAVKLSDLKPGMYVRTAGGVCRVVRVPVKRGRIMGADLLRLKSGNYALDTEGKPYEVPSAYTEHYPEYLINEIVEDPSCA
jgi:translation elongation factor P/translation initiation factor 5A